MGSELYKTFKAIYFVEDENTELMRKLDTVYVRITLVIMVAVCIALRSTLWVFVFFGLLLLLRILLLCFGLPYVLVYDDCVRYFGGYTFKPTATYAGIFKIVGLLSVDGKSAIMRAVVRDGNTVTHEFVVRSKVQSVEIKQVPVDSDIEEGTVSITDVNGTETFLEDGILTATVVSAEEQSERDTADNGDDDAG